MKAARMIFVIAAVVTLVGLTGCTNWEKKYKALAVEHENLKGLYENCQAGSGQTAGIADELASCRAEVQSLTEQLEGCNKAPAQKTGFEGFDQSYDAATGLLTVTLPDAILFDSGKITLKSSSKSQLNKIVEVLQQNYGGKKVDIVGHTDSDPIKKSKWQDNWQLASERALAVVRYLQQKGISAAGLRGVSCGEFRPVGSNKSQNRRVEVVVYTK